MPLRDSHNDRLNGCGNDRFKAAMPQIPGVNDRAPALVSAQPAEWSNEPSLDGTDAAPRLSMPTLIMIGLGVCFAGLLGWWTLHAKRPPAKAATDTGAAAEVHSPPGFSDSPAGAMSAQDEAAGVEAAGVTPVATLQELAKPWSMKKFTFVNSNTHEHVPAMIVRLPGANAGNRANYWAFSLEAPYKTCELDYLENLAEIASRYRYRASHPMVVAPCDATLYDPLRVGMTLEGAWVRGDIAQGPGIRPPISIEVRVQGGRIVADRIE